MNITLKPNIEDDPLAILRVTAPNNTRKYQHPVTKEAVDVYSEDLFEAFSVMTDKFRILIDMLPEKDYFRFGLIFQSLLTDADNRFQQIAYCINRYVGEINIYTINHDQHPYKTGSVVDAELEDV